MFSTRTLLIAILVGTWVALPFHFSQTTQGKIGESIVDCPSGVSEAKLTGWALNGRFPTGSARFDRATGVLDVAVEAIALSDGKVLFVLIGDDRIGELPPLRGGKATAAINRVVEEGARVRVFDGERPLLSANLQCSAAPVSTPTVTPSPSPTLTSTPTPSSTPSPTPSPSPTISPGPSAEPTLDPMPKPSPFPTPSPAAQ